MVEINLMDVLNTHGFDIYELILGNYGLSRLGAEITGVPAWLREVSRSMRQLVEDYTEHIVQRLRHQDIERQRQWKVYADFIRSKPPRNSWEPPPSEPPRPSGWGTVIAYTVFISPYGDWSHWGKPHLLFPHNHVWTLDSN